MSVTISLATAVKVASLITTCLQESTLKKMAKIEAENAIRGCKDLEKENNPRECLNRILTHLESSIGAYTKTLGTWDIFDFDQVMWDQYGVYNKLCALIAFIHFQLGNHELVRMWLVDRMCPEGPWYLYTDSEELKEMGLSDSSNFDEHFYKALLNDSYNEFYKEIIEPSDKFYKVNIENSVQAGIDRDEYNMRTGF